MAKIRSNGGMRNSRRMHFHSYSRGVRRHWNSRTGGTNIGSTGFRHTHDGQRHGHDFSPNVQEHWGRYQGGYSQHHIGYHHSHNTPNIDCPPGTHMMPDGTCMEGAYHGAPPEMEWRHPRKRARKRRLPTRDPRRGRDNK